MNINLIIEDTMTSHAEIKATFSKEFTRQESIPESGIQRAVELMEQTGIAALGDHSINQVSGGQLQRVGICRALINAPEIIFGDEPTGALNSKSAGEIMKLLGDINQAGTTILLVTHDVKVAAKTERVLFMLDGKIVAEYKQGKYDEARDDIKAREERLNTWLVEMGF
jgi:putative ABC transport system ATP-binding protein